MIVKIKNKDGTWNYFEGDNIQQDGYFDGNKAEHKSDMLYVPSDESQLEGTIVFCIQKDNKIIARVHTNAPTYLINDNGKTIDKLI